jgi:hypothetical protein
MGFCNSSSVMEYQWNETKRLINLRKHGIDFADVPALFYGDILTVEDEHS